ncbi:MAG TPA: exodeoxyribonuclease VII small subunit [Abditibacteriaceae bacterium]|jgi:exodeoxyribonuclease VII small subunit
MTSDENLSFEEALHELENIVEALEGSDVPLEQLVELARRGQVLADRCDATLTNAEALLEELIATPEGELVTVPIDYEDDE